MKPRPRVRRWLGRFALGFAVISLLCLSAFVLALNYPKLGRIADFQVIEPVTPLPGTNYTLEYHPAGEHDLELTLMNTISRENTYLATYSRYFTLPTYKLLQHEEQNYLILQLDTGGSASLLWFQVYNLTNPTPYNVIAASDTPDEGLSCTYPRLVENALEFETARDCEFYLIEKLTAGYRTYTIELR